MNMKKKHIKILKQCFGIKKHFFKEKEQECKKCQFKRKCLLKIEGRYNDE